MTNYSKQNILLPKNNTALKRLLQANPELINNYVNELVGVSGGSYAAGIKEEELLRITQSQNIIGNPLATQTLLKNHFIGVN